MIAGCRRVQQRTRPLPFAHHYSALDRDELIFALQRHCKRLSKTLDADDFTYARAIAATERGTRGNFRLLGRLTPQINPVLKIIQLDTLTDNVFEAAASISEHGSDERFFVALFRLMTTERKNRGDFAPA